MQSESEIIRGVLFGEFLDFGSGKNMAGLMNTATSVLFLYILYNINLRDILKLVPHLFFILLFLDFQTLKFMPRPYAAKYVVVSQTLHAKLSYRCGYPNLIFVLDKLRSCP